MPYPHSGFLLDEDEALKALLGGLTVADEQSAARPVPVRFGYGDPELTGATPGAQVSYPFITITLINVLEETDRAHRGNVELRYLPTVPEPVAEETATLAEWPIPISLHYEIVAHARSARHDRQLVGSIISSRLPFRFGALDVDDGTVRRLDILSGPEDAPRYDANGKRVYRSVWTVAVSSEQPITVLREVARVTGVGITIVNLTDRQDRALTQADSASAVEAEVVS